MEADEPFLSENEKKIVILDVEPPENPRIYLRRQVGGICLFWKFYMLCLT